MPAPKLGQKRVSGKKKGGIRDSGTGVLKRKCFPKYLITFTSPSDLSSNQGLRTLESPGEP